MAEEKNTASQNAGEFERAPVPASSLLGFKSFVGMYAGEHCAGTELMIGPLFVALYGMLLMPMGAVIFVDFWLIKKFGLQSGYTLRACKSFNWAAALFSYLSPVHLLACSPAPGEASPPQLGRLGGAAGGISFLSPAPLL